MNNNYGCTGKFPYPTLAQAKKAAKNSNRRKDYKAAAYKCGVCLAFHIGSTIGTLNAKKLAKEKLEAQEWCEQAAAYR